MDDSRKRIHFSLRALAILFVGVAIGLSLGRVSTHFRPRVAPNEAYAFDLPEYLIEPPDIVGIDALAADGASVFNGEFLVGPDGKVNLGRYGSVYLAGCSISQAQSKIRPVVGSASAVTVKVVGYNSKVYYLISDANGTDEVYRIPYTGADNVLDALSNYRDGDVSKQNIWISRPTRSLAGAEIIPVDLNAITARADSTKNYQLLPGDRLFVSSKKVPVFAR